MKKIIRRTIKNNIFTALIMIIAILFFVLCPVILIKLLNYLKDECLYLCDANLIEVWGNLLMYFSSVLIGIATIRVAVHSVHQEKENIELNKRILALEEAQFIPRLELDLVKSVVEHPGKLTKVTFVVRNYSKNIYTDYRIYDGDKNLYGNFDEINPEITQKREFKNAKLKRKENGFCFSADINTNNFWMANFRVEAIGQTGIRINTYYSVLGVNGKFIDYKSKNIFDNEDESNENFED